MDKLHKTVLAALFLGRQDVEVSGRGGFLDEAGIA